MIATIFIGLLLILLIFLLIIFCIDGIADGAVFCGAASVVFIIILAVSLCTGKSIYKQDNTKLLEEKEYIEYCLDSKPSLYSIEQAEKYNNKVQLGNNHWCRFNIEDRSAYLIDIDSYIKVKKAEENGE